MNSDEGTSKRKGKPCMSTKLTNLIASFGNFEALDSKVSYIKMATFFFVSGGEGFIITTVVNAMHLVSL